MTTIDPQEFGRLEARVEQLLEADRAKTVLMERLFERLDNIDRQMSEQRGGWKGLLALSGAAGTLGAAAGGWVTHLLGKGPLS